MLLCCLPLVSEIQRLVRDRFRDSDCKESCGPLSGFADIRRVRCRSYGHEQQDDQIPVYTRPNDKTGQGICGVLFTLLGLGL